MSSQSRIQTSSARPKITRPDAIRLRVVGLAALLGGGLLAGCGAAVWDHGGGGLTGPALLGPIVEYHNRVAEDERQRIGTNRRIAGELFSSGMRNLLDGFRFAYLACTRPQPTDWIIPTDAALSRGAFRDFGLHLDWAAENLRDASWHERLADYHAHAAEYYADLLAYGLPVPVAALPRARRALEDAHLKIYGVPIVLKPEPPPFLLPGYVAPKLGQKPVVPPGTMAPADSY